MGAGFLGQPCADAKGDADGLGVVGGGVLCALAFALDAVVAFEAVVVFSGECVWVEFEG